MKRIYSNFDLFKKKQEDFILYYIIIYISYLQFDVFYLLN